MRALEALGVSLLLCLAPAAIDIAVAAQPAALYDTHCALCHQVAGRGAPAQFPRLAGRAAAIASSTAGRAYLVHVVHNGLSGTIVVDGTSVTGVMPAQAQLSSPQIAQILNYLLSLSPLPHARPKPFTAAEVTALAATAMSNDALSTERKSLIETGVIP